jgi:hypothetical protein
MEDVDDDDDDDDEAQTTSSQMKDLESGQSSKDVDDDDDDDEAQTTSSQMKDLESGQSSNSRPKSKKRSSGSMYTINNCSYHSLITCVI